MRSFATYLRRFLASNDSRAICATLAPVGTAGAGATSIQYGAKGVVIVALGSRCGVCAQGRGGKGVRKRALELAREMCSLFRISELFVRRRVLREVGLDGQAESLDFFARAGCAEGAACGGHARGTPLGPWGGRARVGIDKANARRTDFSVRDDSELAAHT